MPRFTSTILTGFGTIGPDTLEAPDIETASRTARDLASGKMSGGTRGLAVSQAWKVEVADESGAIVSRLSFWADAAGRLHEVPAERDG
jgi:hypothetical protein